MQLKGGLVKKVCQFVQCKCSLCSGTMLTLSVDVMTTNGMCNMMGDVHLFLYQVLAFIHNFSYMIQ